MTALAAIMKSSITIRGAILLFAGEILERAVDIDGTRLDRFQIERAAFVAPALERLRDAVLEAQLGVEPGHGGEWRRGRCGTVQPGGDAVVGELGAIADHRGVDRRAGDVCVGIDRHRDDDGDAILGSRRAT